MKVAEIVDVVLRKLFDHVDIVKEVEEGKVIYLRRYFIYTGKRGNIYLHHIRRSDDDPDPHDHPWDFRTFILWGSYLNVEHVFQGTWGLKPLDHWLSVRWIRWYAKRAAEHVHQVKLINDKPVWTLVFTGPYRREWGFVTSQGWVMWRKYLGIEEGNPYDKVAP